MKKTFQLIGVLILLLFNCQFVNAQGKGKDLQTNDVLAAMKKASKYMAETVSYKGGYLWSYKEDLSEVFGEVPARKSQIWIQSGTPQMGDLFLEMYEVTGDKSYLDYAKKAADALAYGQHPLGGWHYFVDFDKEGLQDWYKNVASRFIVGWEEYRHYYGNCTFDDNTTQGATTFMLHLYMKTLDPAYLEPLKRALNFILISQYPNGGWPQRFPLHYEFVHDGLADYTSYYTLNDNAMNNTIDVLLEAYKFFGDERYLEAAKRGGDFFMVSQGPEGKAAWTDQFDMNLQPAWGRTHEPASFQVRYTTSTIRELEKLFLYTGDKRYLRPIPGALDWIESVILSISDRGEPNYATWYDPKTNYPIIRETLPEINSEGYFKYKYTVDSTAKYIKYTGKLPLRESYEKIRDVEPGKRHEMYDKLYGETNRRNNPADQKTLLALISSMNEKGAWIETFTVHDITRTMIPNFNSVKEKGPYLYAVKEIKGIRLNTYMRNMQMFLNFLRTKKVN
jgi:PelA/Pel-15E family pectate lyase